MMFQNIHYRGRIQLSPWRKISLASWKPTGDSSCYCFEEIEVGQLLYVAQKFNINLNTFVIKACSKSIKLHPEINSTVRSHHIYRRDDIAVFFHVSSDVRQDDLSGILFEESQEVSLKNLNDEYLQKLNLAKLGKNQFSESKKIIGFLPSFFTKMVLSLFSFFAYRLNINLPIFKMPKNSFGSVMLTSVGSLGIQEALCPIAPYTNIPMVISIGRICEIPWVENGEIKIRKVIKFGFTFDHRIMDGRHFSAFLATFKNLIQNPNSLL